jgi:hypothetical protein
VSLRRSGAEMSGAERSGADSAEQRQHCRCLSRVTDPSQDVQPPFSPRAHGLPLQRHGRHQSHGRLCSVTADIRVTADSAASRQTSESRQTLQRHGRHHGSLACPRAACHGPPEPRTPSGVPVGRFPVVPGQTVYRSKAHAEYLPAATCRPEGRMHCGPVTDPATVTLNSYALSVCRDSPVLPVSPGAWPGAPSPRLEWTQLSLGADQRRQSHCQSGTALAPSRHGSRFTITCESDCPSPC